MMESQSSHIKTYFSAWHILNMLLRDEIPELPGTYILRLAGPKSFGRLRGDSDIIYIGSTTDTLRQRMDKTLINKRISELTQKYGIEIAWCTRPPQSLDAGDFETSLLESYQQEHEELPPLNHTIKRG
jgi:hypothetical protein